jgi:hypothetical protein
MCNLDGTQIETLVHYTPGSENPIGITVDPISQYMFWNNAAELTISKAKSFLHLEHNPRTMWTSYGTVPADDKGIKFELAESFPQIQNSDTTGSLLQVCGFTPGSTNVGRVRQTKKIKEAIVAIPYLEYPLNQSQMSKGGITENVTLTTSILEGANFIKIPSWNYERQKENLKTNGVAVPADQNKANSGIEISSTTISRMIESMGKYVLPPNFNFHINEDISPFAMYIFEFEHVLQQQELTDIWQGITPQSALRMENDEVVIAHDLGPFEFFGNIDNQHILGDLKFFVFKVKEKAKQNYYEITEDAIDDSRFNFKFAGDPTATAVPPEGSYNWPYDFFSLVEKAKIEAKFILKNEDEE